MTKHKNIDKSMRTHRDSTRTVHEKKRTKDLRAKRARKYEVQGRA